MDDLLQQGIEAFRAGKRDESRKIFLAVIKQSPDSEQAWGWMSNVCHTDQERIHCLRQALRINPKNEKVQQALNQLLAPPFAAELSLSPVSSAPPPPISPTGKAKSKNSGFSQTQLFVLFALAAMIVVIFGSAIWLFAQREPLAGVPSPTSFATSSGNVNVLPTQVQATATLIPTYAYAPTWTPLPSPTSFAVPTLVRPTSVPQQAQSNPAPASNAPAASSGSDCSSQLDYAAAMHQYNLDAIDYIHSPMISLYQGWIDEATRNRDALGLVKAQRDLDDEQAQLKAEKSSENKRYKAEVGSLNASCS